jgi:hypothetical protein
MSVRQNVRSAKRPSAKCPLGKMSFGKMSFGKVSGHQYRVRWTEIVFMSSVFRQNVRPPIQSTTNRDNFYVQCRSHYVAEHFDWLSTLVLNIFGPSQIGRSPHSQITFVNSALQNNIKNTRTTVCRTTSRTFAEQHPVGGGTYSYICVLHY